MNDFQIVVNSDRLLNGYKPSPFSPEHAADDHEEFLQKFAKVLADENHRNVIVVGHHAPSSNSIHERFKSDVVMNGVYYSDLSNLILDNPKIRLWFHGHVHDSFDYMIGPTRVLCNPRRYIEYEQCADDFQLKYITI